ncbi:Holliday junction ATP-dependent DNA helicase RuvA [Vallitalea longa]|uniref:Holliday junction branch migration complex subunit RuvA n=1 Tax=Vallitalea longa TaxID=2936439 RepID=A0A9W5Y9Z4_9FIRM|nr:Holliday junction branch migration protein RuvA [Vallitalea longa]GKX30052.1 Holliday junction ATP-dependent DNA helicase RuvA [Vallitalea longa]
MISYIKGTLEYIGDDFIIIEAQNIGYEIKISISAMQNLPSIGESVKMHTYLYVREDAMLLYGFLTRDDLEVFKKLITVNGIGPKGALGVLSTITPDELRFAVIADDVKTISKAPGIGKKTAQKLILELKDKLKLKDYMDNVSSEVDNSQVTLSSTVKNDAIAALVALGYTSTEAVKAVRTVNITETTTVEEIIKGALGKLANF